MDITEKQIAMLVMGRPGSGKDTQADFLAEHFDLIRISTSDLLQVKFKESSGDPDLEKERKIFESGELNTPSWVLQTVQDHVEELKKNNFENKGGIIFSGSPRTEYEAENLIPFIEDIFGSSNLIAIYLDIPEDVGIQRILKRGARALDKDAKKLKIRMEEYDNRTKPVLEYLKKRGFLTTVNGEPVAEEISKDILEVIKSKINK